jgi:hypothetical protein
MPRTQQEFDQWFSKGDPWGYSSHSIKSRFAKTLSFILRHIPKTYHGAIIEFGAYNGDFSLLLLEHFPHAKVYINDISRVAMEEIKSKTQLHHHASYVLSDMLTFPSHHVQPNKPVVITLLECFYYMQKKEQGACLKKISTDFPTACIFFSAPIIGGNYYAEDELIKMFKNENYRCTDWVGLNFNRTVRASVFFYWAVNHFSFLRKKLCYQSLYLFKPMI